MKNEIQTKTQKQLFEEIRCECGSLRRISINNLQDKIGEGKTFNFKSYGSWYVKKYDTIRILYDYDKDILSNQVWSLIGMDLENGNFHLENHRHLPMNSIDKRTNNSINNEDDFINLLEEMDSDGDISSIRHQCLDCGEELKVISMNVLKERFKSEFFSTKVPKPKKSVTLVGSSIGKKIERMDLV